jgi:hypothetical protein
MVKRIDISRIAKRLRRKRSTWPLSGVQKLVDYNRVMD